MVREHVSYTDLALTGARRSRVSDGVALLACGALHGADDWRLDTAAEQEIAFGFEARHTTGDLECFEHAPGRGIDASQL